MVVRVRLARFGSVNSPFYRIVVADSRSPRDGRIIEQVGTYNPRPLRVNPLAAMTPDAAAALIADVASTKTKEIALNVDRIMYWIGVGAQPSETVARLLSYARLVPPVPRRVAVETAKPRAERNKKD